MARRSASSGTIYPLKSGHWRAQICLRGHRISKTMRTKQEARAWLTTVTAQAADGIDYAAAQVRLEVFLPRWLEIKHTQLRPATCELYEDIARNYILPALGKIKLSDLTPGMVQSLVDQLVSAHHGARTIQLTRGILHGCLAHALRLGLVSRNVASLTLPPKVKKKPFTIWTESQVSAFLASIAGNRNENLFYLALATGMRQGELLGLHWSDIDWRGQRLQIIQQASDRRGGGFEFTPPKSERGRRAILLGDNIIQRLHHQQTLVDTARAFARQRWKENDLVFPSTVGTPQGSANLSREFKRLAQRAGLPRIRFHDMRHTAASIMLSNNIPPVIAAGILGQSLAVLMDTYAHHIPQTQQAAANLMDQVTTVTTMQLPSPIRREESS